MKKFPIILVFLTTFAQAACPDLAGHYALCRSNRNVLIEGTDMVVKKIDVPNNTFYKISMLADGNLEREEITFPANGVTVKDSWESTGIKYERQMSARCLGNLVQAHTEIIADGLSYVNETSQYFKQGDDLVRISRGTVGELRYTDILTCR